MRDQVLDKQPDALPGCRVQASKFPLNQPILYELIETVATMLAQKYEAST
jgi:hypothetical protein